jgi:hypothetical protein
MARPTLWVRAMQRLAPAWLAASSMLAALGCGAAPQSQIPSAAEAIDRMRKTYSCSRGLQGEASLDYFDEQGRVTGGVLYYAMLPERLRFDVVSPFGVTISTLTSNGEDFALYDLQNKAFLYGPANTCNVSRFTQVPLPPFVLAQLLRGEAPVLVHDPAQTTLEWESGLFSGGHYVLSVRSKHEAFEEIRLAPAPRDFNLPWQSQRMRVTSVRVEQRGVTLYDATLKDHRVVRTKAALPDPDGLAPPLSPSGPACSAEVPRSVRIEVPPSGRDLVFKNSEQWHNPPVPPGVFEQRCPPGMHCRFSTCEGRDG